MGDMADWINEQGADEYDEHLRGECGEDGPCQYCAEREARLAKRRAAYKKAKRAAKRRRAHQKDRDCA